MPRARNIKPAFFTNDRLAECQPLARIMFVGLWTIADKEGRLEDRPKKIKAETLPYDDCDADILLTELHNGGFIKRYTINNIAYIQVVNFAKHQNCHMKENASTIPAPDKSDASTMQVSEIPAPARPLTESFLLDPESLNLKEEADFSNPLPPTKNKTKGTRLGEDWELPDDWGDWAANEFTWDVPKIVNIMNKFKDYWIAKPGAGGIKLNWESTWRNWCRRDHEGEFKK